MCFFPRTIFSDTDYFITIAFKTYFIVHPLDIIVYSKKLEQNVLLVCPCIFSLENTNNYFSFLGGKMEPKEKQSFSSQFQSSFMIEIVRNRLSVIYRLPASLHSFFFFFSPPWRRILEEKMVSTAFVHQYFLIFLQFGGFCAISPVLDGRRSG